MTFLDKELIYFLSFMEELVSVERGGKWQMLHVYQTWQGETFGRKEISVQKKGKFESSEGSWD